MAETAQRIGPGTVFDMTASFVHLAPEVTAGQAFVIPLGTWHGVQVVEPAHVLHVTRGPDSRTRPPTSTPTGARR